MSSPRSSRLDSPPTPSTSRLVLLPDTDDREPIQEYTTDDELEVSDHQPPLDQLPVPLLPPSTVFFYLLSPYLRLGAIYAADIRGVSLTYNLTALAIVAFLSAFCRQIWFLLGRYLRKSSTEDILIYAFARRHRRILKHGLARYFFTAISALFKMLLAAMYLRDAVDAASLLDVPKSIPFPSYLTISLVLSILIFALSLQKSLASRSIIYTTSLSVTSYLAWLVAVSRSYGTNAKWRPDSSPLQRGILWNEISTYAFACATTMTVPLSVSLVAAAPLAPPTLRNTRSRSFEFLNMSSTALAVLLIFPLVIIAASPRAKASIPSANNIVLALRISTLVFSIPSVVVSVISLPLHGSMHRFIHTDLALSIIVTALLALSLVPPAVASILNDVTLFSAVFGSFLVPALAHITIHYFRRPLSIIVPHVPSSAPASPRTSSLERSPSPSRDPLLQRKEWLLQRSRLGKRLLWDIVIWIILIPICACAFVWTVGRVAQNW